VSILCTLFYVLFIVSCISVLFLQALITWVQVCFTFFMEVSNSSQSGNFLFNMSNEKRKKAVVPIGQKVEALQN